MLVFHTRVSVSWLKGDGAMLFTRTIIAMSIAVVSIVVATYVVGVGNAEPPVTDEGPVIIDVPVDAGLVELGQVLHNGS